MTQPILSLRHVRKTRRQDTAFTLDIPAFDVHRGERVALVGPSGCGKSTALDLLGTVLRPDCADTSAAQSATAPAGEDKATPRFVFTPATDTQPVDILRLWQRGRKNALAALRRQYLGYILQTGGLLPFLTAEENILLNKGREYTSAARDIAKKLDIAHLLSRLPGQLSVGQRQRVAIARALTGAPPLILADEPAAALDPLNAQVVLELFTHLAQELHVAVIMVTHAPQSAADMGFRMVNIAMRKEGDDVVATLGGAPC